MKVKIKKMDGSTFELEVNAEDTVQSLKSQVRDHEQVEESRQRLIYHGRVLRDEDLLSIYNLTEEGVLHLVVRPADAPQSAPGSGAPAPAPVDGAPIIQPFQDLGNGVMMGSMALDADQVQPADLSNIFSQLFSTLGHVTTAPSVPPPAQQAAAGAGAPPMHFGSINSNTVSLRANTRPQQPAPLRVNLEQAVANAEVVVDTARIFNSDRADNSLPLHGNPADIDSPAYHLAVAQGLASFHEALTAMQSPVGSVMRTLRSGAPESSRQRIDHSRQTEQLKYLLNRLATSAAAMANTLDALSLTSHVSTGASTSTGPISRTITPVSSTSSLGIDFVPQVDEDEDIDIGLSLPPMAYSAPTSASSAAAPPAARGFLNTIIPSVLTAAVGAFAPHLQAGFGNPIPPSPTSPAVGEIPGTVPATQLNTSSSSDVTHTNSIDGTDSSDGNPTDSRPQAHLPPPVQPHQSPLESENRNVHAAPPAASSGNTPPNSNSNPQRAPVQISFTNTGSGQRAPRFIINGQPTRGVVHRVHRHHGPPGTVPAPGAQGLQPRGIRFVHHHHPNNMHAYSPSGQPVMAQAAVVNPQSDDDQPVGQAPVAAPSTAPVAVPVSSTEQQQFGVGPNSLPRWVQQRVYQGGVHPPFLGPSPGNYAGTWVGQTDTSTESAADPADNTGQ